MAEWIVEIRDGNPNIKKMIPLVRCKDCKHRDPEDKKCDCGMWHVPFSVDDDDFCSYGEKVTE